MDRDGFAGGPAPYRGVLCLYSYIPGSEVEDAADDGVLKVG